MPGSVGKTETQFFHYGDGGEPALALRCGQSLDRFTIAYEMYGEMSAGRDNVILLFHALSASQHAAGITESVPGLAVEWDAECQAGWWDGFIGPGKALDTDRFCVVCANYLGGCYGSTGPASENPATGKPFGSAFPRVAVADIVDSQIKLLDHLGVDMLHATLGSSLGGLMALSLATRYPGRVGTVIPLASGVSTSVLQRIHNLEQIGAIEADGNFKGGDYYGGDPPARGLALARMIGHKSFISLRTLEKRAQRVVKDGMEEDDSWYQLRQPIESYMLHQGRKFVRRFDANTYLRIMDAWQSFDLLAEAGFSDYAEMFARCRHQRFLIFTIDSDVCFYPDQQEELAEALAEGGVSPIRITVHSEKGHDSFLLEPELYTPHLHYTLEGRVG